MRKNPAAFVLLLTLITIVTWIVLQVVQLWTKSTIPTPDQQLMREINPTLDKTVIDDLKKSLQ